MTFIRSTAGAPPSTVISGGQLPALGNQESAGWAYPTTDSGSDFIKGGGIMDGILRGGAGGTVQFAHSLNTTIANQKVPNQRAYAPASGDNYFYTTDECVNRQTGFSSLWFGAADTHSHPGGGGISRVFVGFSQGSPAGVLNSANPSLLGGYFGWWSDKQAGDNNWHVIHAASNVAPTKVDTGLITDGSSGSVYYWFETKAADNGNIDFRVYDRADLTNVLFSTTVSSNIPINGQVLVAGWGVRALDGNTFHSIHTACFRLNISALG